MKTLKILFLTLFIAGAPVLLSACEQQSDLEEGVEEIQDEIDDATTN